MTGNKIVLAVSLLVSLASTLSREICCLIETIFVAFVPRVTMVTARTLVLPQVRRHNAAVMREKVISVVDARTRAMLLFIEWLDDTVTYLSLLVL